MHQQTPVDGAVIRRWAWVVIAVLLCLLLARPFANRMRPQRTQIVDFYQEWSSAKNVLTGRPVYLPIDETFAPYLKVVRKSNEPLYWDINVHPPTSVLLGIPFGLMDYPNAMLAWNVCSLLALAASGWLIAHQLQLKSSVWLVFPLVSILLLCNPLWQQVTQGQLNLVLLLLLVGCWAAQRRGDSWLAGICLGLAITIKLFPGFLLVYFLLQRQWRTVLLTAVTVFAASLLTVAVLGVDAYADYYHKVLPRAVEWQSTWNNASLGGLWSKLFDPSQGHTLTMPLLASPLLKHVATGLSWLVILAVLGRLIWRAQGTAARDQAFGATIVAMLLLSPVTWEHYFLLLLLPIVLVWSEQPRPLARSLALMGIGFVLCLPIYLMCEVMIPGGFRKGTATPAMTLTLLSLQCYALIGLFILAAAGSRHAMNCSERSKTRLAGHQ